MFQLYVGKDTVCISEGNLGERGVEASTGGMGLIVGTRIVWEVLIGRHKEEVVDEDLNS